METLKASPAQMIGIRGLGELAPDSRSLILSTPMSKKSRISGNQTATSSMVTCWTG